MQCLQRYDWVKLLRSHLPEGKGVMGAWAKLASRAAFRKGNAYYCGFSNPVEPGMWAGGVVGLKSILGSKKRHQALQTMERLQELGFISYELDPATKKLTYQILDWVVKCSGAECMDGAVYTTDGYGFCAYPEILRSDLLQLTINLRNQMHGWTYGATRYQMIDAMRSHSLHRQSSTESMVPY